MSQRSFVLGVALLGVLYAIQGLYYARVLAPTPDAIQYLFVGVQAVTGERGVYDDHWTGNRLPLPFYVLGLTQLLGPSLWIPRLMNVLFGLATLGLTIALAQRLGGPLAGLLAGLFLATQAVVIGYWTYEGYPVLAALLFTLTTSLALTAESAPRRLLGVALTALLFFVRSNLWPAALFLFGHSLWRAAGTRERAVQVGIVTLPVLVFFAWDPENLKILGSVPVVSRLVEPLGYYTSVVFYAEKVLPLTSQLWNLVRIARRYEFWVFAVAVLAGLEAWRWRTRRTPSPWMQSRTVKLLAGLLVFVFVANLMMYRWTWKWVGLYFVTFATPLPVLLGLGFGHHLAETAGRPWARRALVLVLAVLLLPPLYFVRNPLLPIGDVKARDPFGSVHVAAAHLRRVVPRDAKVFFFGRSDVYYLSGLPLTYPAQLYNQDQFSMIPAEDWVLRRSGFVPVRDVRYWLSSDADYAVIDLKFLDYKLTTPSLDNPEALMQALLARHFARIDTIDEFPLSTYAVYRRKPTQAGARGATSGS